MTKEDIKNIIGKKYRFEPGEYLTFSDDEWNQIFVPLDKIISIKKIEGALPLEINVYEIVTEEFTYTGDELFIITI